MNFAQLIDRFRRIKWMQPSVIALVLANLAPLAAVFVFRWDVFSLLFLFWLENVIIGVVNVLKMLFAGTGANDLPRYGSAIFWAIKAFLIPFFCVHYGIFTLVHGVFIIALFDKGLMHHGFGINLPMIIQIIQDRHLEWPFAGLVASHLISFGWDYLWRGEFRHTNPMELMTQPYRRIVVMHLTIIFGGFLMVALHSPEAGLVLLVVLKTAFDLRGHQGEREKFSQSGKSTLGSGVTVVRNPVAAAIQSRAAMFPQVTAGGQQKMPVRGIIIVIFVLVFFLAFIGNFAYQFVRPLISGPRRAQIASAPAGRPPALPLDLTDVQFPETPAAGRFYGLNFSVARASYANGKLTLDDGKGIPSHSFVISLETIGNELPGKSFDLKGQSGLPEIKMILRASLSYSTTQPFVGGYALRLDFGNRSKNKIPAKIYLCLPDAQKSYVAGTLTVTIKKEKEPGPVAEKQ